MAQLIGAEVDTYHLLRVLRRSLLVLAAAALAIAAASYVGLGFVEPIYTADTKILIEERESPLARPRDAPAEPISIQFDEAAIQSQVEVLRSRDIANRVIDKLDLVHVPELDPAAKPSALSSILVVLGLKTAPTEQTRRQRVMDAYFENLSVYPVEKSRVITVEFEASDPETAANVANAIAESYVMLQREAKRESIVAATGWLEDEIEKLRERLAEAEQKVERFRSGSELFNTGQVDSTLSTQQLGEINAELARAKAARSEAEARAELVEIFLSEPGSVDISEEVLNSPLIQRLQEREVTLRAEIAELSASLLPTHPRIQALQSQFRNLEGQIRREADKVLQSLRTAARVASARVEALEESLNEAKAAVSQSNEEGIELRAFEREATAQRNLLEAFLARYREAVARTNSGELPTNARIISAAVPPQSPSFPKQNLMAAFAGTTAFLFGAGLVLLREFMSGRAFRGMGEEPRPMPRVAEAPALRREPDLPFGDPVASPPADPALLPLHPPDPADLPGAVEVAEALAKEAVRVALFAGVSGGEGAGEIAMASARLVAGSGLRSVLIDVGVVPSDALGGGAAPGLGDLLSGNAAFGEVIRRDEGTHVHFIAMGSAVRDAPLERLALAVGALTHAYDKVVIVADGLGDWPAEHVRPDLAAIVCGPDLDEAGRRAAYERALEQGARSALIIRRVADADGAGRSEPDEMERGEAGAAA
jgi:succinoglycan biosynthesis transport protein ExoP